MSDQPSDKDVPADMALPPRQQTAMQFLLRGLAISLPPVLTLVILIWVGQVISSYILNPVSMAVRYTIAQFIDQSLSSTELHSLPELPRLEYCGRDYLVTSGLEIRLKRQLAESSRILVHDIDFDEVYVPVRDRMRAIPYEDYRLVASKVRSEELPTTVTGMYMEVVTRKHFQGFFHLSAVAIFITIIVLYFLGRFVTVRLGSWIVNALETRVLARLPLISNVYSSVKQVTDFLFTERTVEYSRVVALEYPRRGIWSLGFVTGDGLLDVTAAAGEPMVTVLIPTSPMPVTGYTMSVPHSEVIDLNITIDQAFQFCISCGVLVPDHQKVTVESLQQALAKRLATVAPMVSTGDRSGQVAAQNVAAPESVSNPDRNEASP